MNMTNIKILSYSTIVLTSLLAFVNLSEWYAVKVQGRIEGYPFSSEGPTPYYYHSAEMYSSVMLVWGSLYLSTLILSLSTMKSGNVKWKWTSLSITLLLMIGQWIHSQVGMH